MKKDKGKGKLEEITIQEFNRIGDRLGEELEVLKSMGKEYKCSDDDLNNFIGIYTDKIKYHNTIATESNSFLGDHKIKYYKDKDGIVSYRAIKKEGIGFIK